MRPYLSVTDTIIHVTVEGKEIFQYNYMNLFTMWRNESGYDIEDEDGNRYEPDGYSISASGNELYIGLLECADQVGILGIIDMKSGELIHAQNADYYLTCLTNHNYVICLCFIYSAAGASFCSLGVKKKGCKCFEDFDDYIDIPKSLYFGYFGDVQMELEDAKLIIHGKHNTEYEVDVSEYIT